MEVVFGLQFEAMTSLLVPHFGLLWRAFRKEYPKIDEKPPLTSRFEHFGPRALEIEQTIELSDTPPLPRVWFISDDDSFIIQLQRDRFLHNWRRVGPGDEYPRFETLFPLFCQRYESFLQFLSAAGLEEPKLNQFELTYVNHIPFDYIANDVGEVFPDHVWRPKGRFLSRPESFNWRSSFDLPDQQGRMHVVARTARSIPTGEPLLSVEITARGTSSQSDEWFRTAREYIVRGFEDLTSKMFRTESWKQQ